MKKNINLMIAYLIFAATIVKVLLSLTYIFITQPMALFLEDLFSRLNFGVKRALLNIDKHCYYEFSYSGIELRKKTCNGGIEY